MLRHHSITLFIVTALLSMGCAKRQMVSVPPRVDLHALGPIGIVQFSGTEGKLSAFATQRFIEALQESQPGVAVLELGKVAELTDANGNMTVNQEAIRAAGERYNVAALIVGDLVVQDVRPNIDLHNIATSLNVSADVDAGLTARLLETGRGATVWTRATRATRRVAQVGLGGGQVSFDARDPKAAYGDLVDTLVNDITHDFRPSYVRQ